LHSFLSSRENRVNSHLIYGGAPITDRSIAAIALCK
jgi:hypothetical protein